jgi:anti-sigma factor RsiW
MDCNWTEKISLLIDGELPAEEARAVESHLADCHTCQHAREDFMLLRQQISSYHAESNLIAQRQALKKILGVEARVASSGLRARGWRERVGGVFALPRLSPALAAVVALVVFGIVIGIVVMRRAERVEVAANPNHGATAHANTNTVVIPTPAASTERVNVASTTQPRIVATASGEKVRRAANLSARKLRDEEARQPKIINRLKLPLTPKLSVDSTELVETQLASLSSRIEPSDLSTSRHVEQAQQLLRSFRNARVEREPSFSDIAYEKRRSRELLYRNIVLRREAASKGNVSVESLLDNLEPILMDIANLPDRPAQEDVRSITERMRKKNIVAMLQVANASRMY